MIMSWMARGDILNNMCYVSRSWRYLMLHSHDVINISCGINHFIGVTHCCDVSIGMASFQLVSQSQDRYTNLSLCQVISRVIFC